MIKSDSEAVLTKPSGEGKPTGYEGSTIQRKEVKKGYYQEYPTVPVWASKPNSMIKPDEEGQL